MYNHDLWATRPVDAFMDLDCLQHEQDPSFLWSNPNLS